MNSTTGVGARRVVQSRTPTWTNETHGMTRTASGDFVVKARTIKQVAAVIAGLLALGPSLGVGISLIAKDINRERDISELKVRMAEIPAAIDIRLDKIDDKLISIEEFLRK